MKLGIGHEIKQRRDKERYWNVICLAQYRVLSRNFVFLIFYTDLGKKKILGKRTIKRDLETVLGPNDERLD